MAGTCLLLSHHVVFITFTALLVTEFIMVALTIHTWHWIMLLAEIFSITVYLASLYILDTYFGKEITINCVLKILYSLQMLMSA